jgi:HEAT repeat protein
MPTKDILARLEGGDRRTIGRADEVAALVARNPRLFSRLMEGLWSENALVRMRAADAAEKVTREKPGLLRPFKGELLDLMGEATQQEVRWHLAAMVPRLALNGRERELAISLLNRYLDDRSSIVRTFALQGMADLAEGEPSIRPSVIEILREATRTGTAAMKARSRKLLMRLEKSNTKADHIGH